MTKEEIDILLATVFGDNRTNIPKLRKIYRSLNKDLQIYFLTNLKMSVNNFIDFAYGMWSEVLNYNLVLKYNVGYLIKLLDTITLQEKTYIPAKYCQEIFERIINLGRGSAVILDHKKQFAAYLKKQSNPQEVYNKFVKTKEEESELFFLFKRGYNINTYAYLSKFIRFETTKATLFHQIGSLMNNDNGILKDKEFFDKYVYPSDDINVTQQLHIMEKNVNLMTVKREQEFIKYIIDRASSEDVIMRLKNLIKFNENYNVFQSCYFIKQLEGGIISA